MKRREDDDVHVDMPSPAPMRGVHKAMRICRNNLGVTDVDPPCEWTMQQR